MRRHICQPRHNWRDKVGQIGLTYHSHETAPYWDESACYEFSAREIDVLEEAAGTLHQLCLDAAAEIVRRGWWDRLSIPETAVPLIVRSWERKDFSLYGRFDLSYGGDDAPKLLEYNADTPTSLVEASVAQWFWLRETMPKADQFNSLHERLIAAWRRWDGGRVHFSSVREQVEDEQTVTYLQDTCVQAGIEALTVFIDEIGWHPKCRGTA